MFKKGQSAPWAKNNPQIFKKGQIPWNKGKKFPGIGGGKKGRTPWNKGKKCPQLSGENHHWWKGGITKQKGYYSFKEIRRKIQKLNNGGSHTLSDWQILKAQYNWTCPACRRKEPEIKLTEDHIIPTSKGGSDNIENIQPLCVSCNTKKMTKIIKYEIHPEDEGSI